MRQSFSFILLILLCINTSAQPSFKQIVIDDNLSGAYQVSVADINNDGKPDIAGLSSSVGVYWYENPLWQKRPIVSSIISNAIDLAFHDMDDDGEVELALAYNFNLNNSEIGSVGVLKRNDDLSKEWQLHHLVDEPTVHRLRWADVNHDGKQEIVVAPIIGRGAHQPEYNQAPARQFVLYSPKNPMSEDWQQEFFDTAMHLTHGMSVWNHPGLNQNVVLVAGEEGVKQFHFSENKWDCTQLCSGAPIDVGRTGSSEIAVGYRNNTEPFFATIEPWHGHQVVVYMGDDQNRKRTVIDESFDNGHAIACADFDKDGQDEIIAGYRGSGGGVYLYDLDNDTNQWKRHEIDKNGLAAQGFFVTDINDDGWLDFIGGGGATKNVKLYLNNGN